MCLVTQNAYPYVPGTETQWEGWNYFGVPRAGIPPRVANLELPAEFEKYVADEKPRPDVDALKYDLDHDPATLGRARQIYDALSFDLRAVKARGGKISYGTGGLMVQSAQRLLLAITTAS
jgi:hypothetical protein